MSEMMMNVSLAKQLEKLMQLQGIDQKIDQILREKDDLPLELSRIESLVSSLELKMYDLNVKKQEIEKLVNQTKAANDLNFDRLTKAEKKCEEVSNQTEYQAALKEIEQLKKMQESLSDQLTLLNTDLASIDTEISKIQLEVAAQAEVRDNNSKDVLNKIEGLNSHLSQLENEKSLYLGHIPKSILVRYERVRKVRDGLGIVEIKQGQCQGCFRLLPHQLVNEIRRGSALHQCPYCQRVLTYIPE